MNSDVILLGHGSGGKLSHELLERLVLPLLSKTHPQDQNDAAVLGENTGRLAFTTDSYVVDPIFFPGGDIGHLSIYGTVNDLSMSGAKPLYISVGLIIEEGFKVNDLKAILQSMRDAASKAEITIVTGDTKVVPHGKVDKIFINTAGIGLLEHPFTISGAHAKVGDKILINGTLGDHGMAVLASREGLELENSIVSDCAPLSGIVTDLIKSLGSNLHSLRDPTRGGVASTLKEIALQSSVEIRLEEEALPIRPEVAATCSILGLDPLYVANEGKFLAFVSADASEQALGIMRSHELGKDAAIIGEVSSAAAGKVRMQTTIGGVRAIEMLAGEQLPRIC